VVILKKQGFTLIELLAVVIILGVIAVIAVPTIKGVIKNSTKEAFIVDVKNVIKAVDFYMLDDEDVFLLEGLELSSLEDILNISSSNYSSIKISFDRHLNPFIKLVGKDKWEGLMACGTYNDLQVGSDIDCEVPPFPAILPDGQLCGSVFYDGRDGNKYKTVQIGDQCWFAENLRYTDDCLEKNFSDANYGACMIHIEEEDDQGHDVPLWAKNKEVLYQWGALMNGDGEGGRGLCPSGWHLPTDEEWSEMAIFICENKDGDNCNNYKTVSGWFGEDIELGNLLKSINDWGEEGRDKYGFKGRPAGFRNTSGTLLGVGFTRFGGRPLLVMALMLGVARVFG
jgi:uncharacterized protein (TIGR02145 family)/prepilin-type N-terminal cleavage/methylation domain-containing protein